jgi:hypothetical protein
VWIDVTAIGQLPSLATTTIPGTGSPANQVHGSPTRGVYVPAQRWASAYNDS